MGWRTSWSTWPSMQQRCVHGRELASTGESTAACVGEGEGEGGAANVPMPSNPVKSRIAPVQRHGAGHAGWGLSELRSRHPMCAHLERRNGPLRTALLPLPTSPRSSCTARYQPAVHTPC